MPISVFAKLSAIIFLGFVNSVMSGEWDTPARYLFSASNGGQQLAVIDTKENILVGQVDLAQPINEIAVSAFGNHAYLGHAEHKSVSVVDLSAGKYSHSVALPMAPRHMTSDSYAGLLITDSVEGGMVRIGLGGKKIIFHNSDIPPANDVIMSPSGVVAYWASGSGAEIGAVSVEDGKELWRHKIADHPVKVNPLVRSLDGLFIVATLPEEGRLITVDAGNGELLLRKQLGKGLQRPYVTANGQYFLIPETSSRQLHIYSQVTLQVVDAINLPEKTPLVTAGFFDIIGLGYADKAAYAFDLMNPHAKKPTTIPLPAQAFDAIVTSDSQHAYAALPMANAIAHISLKNGKMQLIEGIASPHFVEMGASNAVCH
ncbi:MAG: hypothetical protein V7754_06830 [Halioglobus sp.]